MSEGDHAENINRWKQGTKKESILNNVFSPRSEQNDLPSNMLAVKCETGQGNIQSTSCAVQMKHIAGFRFDRISSTGEIFYT